MLAYRLKLLTFGVILVLLLGYLGSSLLERLSSPEDRIRAALDHAIAEFNDGDPRAAKIFSRDYRDEGGSDKEDVLDGLRWLLMFSGEKHRADLREEQLVIDVAEDEAQAQVAIGVAIWREPGRDAPWWDLHAVLDFENRSGRWKVAASRDVNHHGRGR